MTSIGDERTAAQEGSWQHRRLGVNEDGLHLLPD